jgi:hypothetical protein
LKKKYKSATQEKLNSGLISGSKTNSPFSQWVVTGFFNYYTAKKDEYFSILPTAVPFASHPDAPFSTSSALQKLSLLLS